MSQARARTFHTVKSLNYLCKLCSGTNASRSYSSISSFNSVPFVKELSTLSPAATDASSGSRYPNAFLGTHKNSIGNGKDWSFGKIKSGCDRNSFGVYEGNFMRIQTNLSVPYGQSYYDKSNDQNKRLELSSNRLYEEGRNVQSSDMIKSGIPKDDIGGGNDQYLGDNVRIHENQGNYNMSKHGQYNVSESYSGNAPSNQQKSIVNNQIPNGYCQVQSCFQPNEESVESVEERRLLVTIEVFDAYCKDGKLKEAVELLGLLEQNNVSVDIPRYLVLIKACGESQTLTDAKQVHNHLKRSVPHLDVSISNKILEMYSKCGSMEDAYKVFDKMPQRNLTSWDTMITWLAKNGHGEDAIEMFNEFKRIGLKPDHQMFHGVFTACSVIEDMREGLLHFESMIKTYNLVPSMDHYASVVDMLGSAGYLNEALEFMGKMTNEPSVEIWEIMMKQSRVHGDVELGDRFTEMVNLLDPSRLDQQSKEGLIPLNPSDIAKEKEREKEKKKSSGLATPFINTKIYEFRAGDKSHPERDRLYSQLRRLSQHMKEAGYVAETKLALHDIDEESKEEALLSHSERLALSHCLLTSPPRAPIRIIKNLRVCVDCHNALKIISKVVGRSIIARDAKRFHLFENGECSCGDYW